MSEPLNILSLGGGVQSTCVLLMSCHGLLPKLDHAIFADTGWEPKLVYQHMDWLRGEVKKFGIDIITVSNGSLKDDIISHMNGTKKRLDNPPLFTVDENGKLGQIRRKCTSQYKIRPLERYIKRHILKIKRFCKLPTNAVNLWFGISSEEQRRVRISTEHWKNHHYPLIGLPFDFGYSMTREDCKGWLKEKYPHIQPVKSACLGCPFHSAMQWKEVSLDKQEWEETCDLDNKLRQLHMMKSQTFLHRERVPLSEVDLDKHTENTPMNQECLGYCGS